MVSYVKEAFLVGDFVLSNVFRTHSHVFFLPWSFVRGDSVLQVNKSQIQKGVIFWIQLKPPFFSGKMKVSVGIQR